MNRKIAVCTTFPADYWNICAAEMLASFKTHWPEDIKIYIQLDEMLEEQFNELDEAMVSILGEGRCFIAGQWEDEQKDFRERWKDNKPSSYMFDAVKFSNKIFAIEKCADAIKDDIDYLIWLDADVITKKQITHEWLDSVLPAEDELVSYLGRDLENNGVGYSECGFLAFNLKYTYGQGNTVPYTTYSHLIKCMKDQYVTDSFSKMKDGWTDCHVFDLIRAKAEGVGAKTKNLSVGAKGVDVWPFTKLAEKMVHRKGNRKIKAVQNRGKDMSVVDSSDLKVKTKNCLDHGKICSNIKENLSKIRVWATLTNPTMIPGTDKKQPVVICSAGPSLSRHIEEIKQKQKDGAKIIAVKHALDTLKAHDVKPWGVVLLDPRAHVEGFVKEPDPDCVYFVASMCDPSVVDTLNAKACSVVGYHALVNAGELSLMIPGDLPVSGGSATSTRSISLFADMFGFREFHLYGYDLCHYEKPNLEELLEDGNKKFLEVTIGAKTHNNGYVKRTFWTEGQFIAQSNELQNLYKDRNDLSIEVYGDGMAGWMYKHHVAYKSWEKNYNLNLDLKRANAADLDSFINAATRGPVLSRG